MSTNTSSTPTEFVAEAFETAVDEDTRDRLLEVIDDAVTNLRKQMKKDETVENLLRADPGSYLLTSSMTIDGLQPESFTQDAVINPLLDALGHDYATEAGGLSGGKTQVADYTVSLRDHPEIDSTRLLIEAEPINKDLDSRKHGIGQVRDWLSQREFESDFGFATDGLRWVFVRYDPDSYTHNVIEEVDLRPVFLALFENQVGSRDSLPEAVLDADLERVTRLIRTFHFENFVSIAGDAQQVLKQKKEEITDEFYDDYIRYVFGIVSDEETTARSLVGDGVVAPEGATEEQARLFAVELMNRLIFIKFLEDKSLVHPDLLKTLKETYESGVHTDSFYGEFCQALFYDVMNNKPDGRPEHVQNIDLFQNIPYLNGGLFRPTINGDEFEEADFDVRNSVLFSIIDLLERYSFSAGGSPTDLDPSVLGNVFEKTINYITSDNADSNKELGAYYTPSEITRFCAEETVRPALLERFQTVLIEECDWPEHSVNGFDSIYELIEGLPGHMGTIGPLLDEVNEFRVVDPACGSGHFLTSVLEEIVNIRKALYAQNESYPDEYRLKKITVLENIYGVDLMGPAVEIAKLRCWLSIISELETENVDDLAEDNALALPNIAFNLREGNSLIGYTGFPETNGDDQYRLGSFSGDSVRDRYQDIIDEIKKHEQAIDSETAEEHRQNAFERLQEARAGLIEDIHADFVESGVEDITPEMVEEMKPFNWVLEFAEVYSDGGFDVIVGNPPWDVLAPNRGEFFSRYDEKFRSYGPEKKNQRESELLEQNHISQEYERYKRNFDLRATYFNNSGEYTLQSSTVAGQTMSRENDLAVLFLERIFSLARGDGYVAQILPGFVFNGAATKNLRMRLLEKTSIRRLVTMENNSIFSGLHGQAKFGVVVFQNSGKTDELKGKYVRGDTEIFNSIDSEAITIPDDVLKQFSPEARSFPYIESKEELEVLRDLIQHPSIGDETNDSWFIHPYRELDRAQDSDRFIENESEGDYPVYGGSNIYQYTYTPDFVDDIDSPSLWSVSEDVNPERSAKHRIREKSFRSRDAMVSPKKAIYEKFDGSGSQKGFVNDLLDEHRGEPLSLDDVLLDCTEYRIVFRNITQSTNERTIVSSVIPKGIVCHHALNTIRPYTIEPEKDDLSEIPLHNIYERVFTDSELFLTLGLLNSIPFDYLMRSKTEENVVIYKLVEAQAPHLTEGDEWFEYIWTRAARLNCYGEDFEEMRDRLGGIEPATDMDERREVQAELDAAAFHAYGLDREQTAFVLDDFHRVQNPRLMDEDYFEMVLEKYDSLDEPGEAQQAM